MAFINKDQEAVPEMQNSKFGACLSLSWFSMPKLFTRLRPMTMQMLKIKKNRQPVEVKHFGAALSAVTHQVL